MVILGIDPGTAITGYGVIRKDGATLLAVESGVIRTGARMATPARLAHIHHAVTELIARHSVDTLATERLFFARNEATAFGVGRSIGVVLLAAAEHDIPWTEYTPLQVKQAVVGYGAAEKRQVQYMVQRILGLDAVPTPDDAADALAVAICHANMTRRLE